MATFHKFNKFVEHMNKGDFSGAADTFTVMLTNTTPVATNELYSDVSGTELANGDGYTTGGTAVGSTGSTNSSGTESEAGNAVTFTSTTGNMGPFQYAILYVTHSANKYLVGWWDYGSAVTLNGVAGETFTITFNSNVLYTVA